MPRDDSQHPHRRTQSYPTDSRDSRQPAASSATNPARESRRGTLLVVGARTGGGDPLVTVLRDAGYRVLEATTRQSGVELARADQPDLIIADILMPTTDGYQLVRELREPPTAGIPVIIYTPAWVLTEVQRLATARGISHIIVRPCEPDHIISVVVEARSSTHKTAATPSRPSNEDDGELLGELLRAINVTLLEKLDELRDAVILAGTLDQKITNAIAVGGRSLVPPSWPPEERLAPRERELLAMLAQGATNVEIAERLVITPSTVQTHIKTILRKLGARNRTEAAARYLRRS